MMDEQQQNERLRHYEELVDRITELGVAERTAVRVVIMIANDQHGEERPVDRIAEAIDLQAANVIKLPRRIP